MPKAVYQQAFLDPWDSPKMLRLAEEIWRFVQYCMESRKPREKQVQDCDEAYLCHRYIPDTGTLELIEDGEFGESDIFDNMNYMSIRQTLALMPRNTPWLTVSSREGEAEQVIQAIQDQQIFMHKKARTRRNVQRHIKQKNVRGRSAIYWEWREDTVLRRITDVAENATQLKAWLKKAGMTKKDAEKLTNGRYPHVISSGPVLYPIDWYDLFVPPSADLVNHRRPTTIVRRFRIREDLMAERDDKTGLKDKYPNEIIKKLQPVRLEELMTNSDHAGGRIATQRLFGQSAVRQQSGLEYIPVFICYFPHFKFDYEGHTEHYWDTYFHLALDGAGNRPQLIFAEENPSDLGRSHILIDDCIDWFTPWDSGGIGLVEKQLARYNQKNLLQLIWVTAAAHSLFPAQLIASGAFRDDEEISFAPGALNVVQEHPLGLNVMRPVETPQNGVMLGEQVMRFYSEDMKASSGLDGLATDNPARSISARKTATEINRDMSTGSLYLDNQAENDAELLTDLCQAIFEESQMRLLPNREGMLEYEKYLGEKVVQGRLNIADFKVGRSIQVLGVEGAANRAQEMANLLQGLDISTRVAAANPAGVPYMMAAMLQIWRRLNIQMPEQMQDASAAMAMMGGMPPGPMGPMGPEGMGAPPGPGGDPSQQVPPEVMQQLMGVLGNATNAA